MQFRNFDDILAGWQDMIDQVNDLFEEGRNKFLDASQNYFDSMQYFSEMSGNGAMKNMYQSISKSIDKLKNKIDKK